VTAVKSYALEPLPDLPLRTPLRTSRLAVASLIMGVVALVGSGIGGLLVMGGFGSASVVVMGSVPLLTLGTVGAYAIGFVGIFLGLVGMACGIVAILRIRGSRRTMGGLVIAVVGLVLSALAFIFPVIDLVLWAATFTFGIDP
jgi:hypothetical protein